MQAAAKTNENAPIMLTPEAHRIWNEAVNEFWESFARDCPEKFQQTLRNIREKKMAEAI